MAVHRSEVVTAETAAHFQDAPKGDIDLTTEARHRLQVGLDGHRSQLTDYKEDVRFLDGEGQWSDEAKNLRGNDRPMLTINKLPAFVDQAIGANRQNQIAIHVAATSQVGDEDMTSKAGKQMSRADAYEGLIRDIQTQSDALDAYATAHETTLAGGRGPKRPTKDSRSIPSRNSMTE